MIKEMILDSVAIEGKMFHAKYVYENMFCVCWFPLRDFREWLDCNHPNHPDVNGTFRMNKNPDIVCEYINEMIGSDGHKYLLDTLKEMNIIYSE